MPGLRRAFLLAAGKGTRLRPLTDTVPKCLVAIGDTTLLDIWLDRLAEAGIQEVLINTHHLAEVVEKHLELRRSKPPSVVTSFEPELLGSAGTVLANRDFVRDEESFAVVYSDNLTDVDLAALERCHRGNDGLLTLGVYPTDQPHRCGIVETAEDGRVVSFEEKPLEPRSNLANAGIYLCRQAVIDMIPRKSVADFGFDVLPRLTGRMFAFRIKSYIQDIGTLENYDKARHEWQARRTEDRGTV